VEVEEQVLVIHLLQQVRLIQVVEQEQVKQEDLVLLLLDININNKCVFTNFNK
jgi:hypothetical protein